MVPGEVAAAVMTRRVELLAPLRRRIKKGDYAVEKSDGLALLDLVADAIREAEADDERRRVLIVDVRALRENLKGTLTTLDRITTKFSTGEPDDPEEDPR
jgi:hypothetical protein